MVEGISRALLNAKWQVLFKGILFGGSQITHILFVNNILIFFDGPNKEMESVLAF